MLLLVINAFVWPSPHNKRLIDKNIKNSNSKINPNKTARVGRAESFFR